LKEIIRKEITKTISRNCQIKKIEISNAALTARHVEARKKIMKDHKILKAVPFDI